MQRREFIKVISGTAVAWPLAARAQQPRKVARIGFLRYASPNEKHFNAFRDGLRTLGYVEGENIVIEQRYANGVLDRLGALAAELVGLHPDVIVVDGDPASRAAKAATSVIPVVFTLTSDPVGGGVAASLARPGANLTGLTLTVGYQLAGKRVEMLKEVNPDLSRLAVLAQLQVATEISYLREIEGVCNALGLSVRPFDARSLDALPGAFAAMTEWQANGVITLNDAFFFSQRDRIVKLALNKKLAAVHPEREFVEAGGLLSYGPNLGDLFRRAASYVDKILKGTNPGEIPIEQPTKFELVVNLQTAKALGLAIPESFLVRVDEVIE